MNRLVDFDSIADKIAELDDDVVRHLKFSVPWQHDPTATATDPEGRPVYTQSSEEPLPIAREELQAECWNKFNLNPQVNTAIRGLVGRMVGKGFEVTSKVREIQEVVDDTSLDHRNRLYHFWPKYVGRSSIEGELFLCLTCHRDGFVEIDFIDPSLICEGGEDDTGIIFHPDKTNMPLFYNVSLKNGVLDEYEQIPSIFIARFPELVAIARKDKDFKVKNQKNSRSRSKFFKKVGGFKRFIISWDRGFITKRSTSYLKTTLQWLNYYEMLKKYEIDHKKSVGSYVWVFSIEKPKDFRLWMSMTDDQRAKTGIAAKKTPGSTLVLPPGVTCEVKSPQLPSIKDEDTDILQMVTSGLNEPADITTGTSKGTFASVKESRGPMSDRTSDEISYFDRFLRFDFWGNIFFLKSRINNFPEYFKINEAVRFKPAKSEDGEAEPVFENVKRRPEELIDISYPISEIIDFDARARGLLGVKHGSVSESLGIPTEQIAKSLGFGSYGRNRLRKATEDRNYPKLILTMDQESLQENIEGNVTESRSAAKKPAAKPAAKKPAGGK